jgi:hypothetical protein
MSCIPREITGQSFGRLTAVRRVGPCTRAALWVVKKGRSLGGLDFDQGGPLPCRSPLQPSTQAGAQQLTTSSGCTTFARSYWRKRAAISRLFARNVRSVTLPALKIERSKEFWRMRASAASESSSSWAKSLALL